jgi:hypothetical protein
LCYIRYNKYMEENCAIREVSCIAHFFFVYLYLQPDDTFFMYLYLQPDVLSLYVLVSLPDDGRMNDRHMSYKIMSGFCVLWVRVLLTD